MKKAIRQAEEARWLEAKRRAQDKSLPATAAQGPDLSGDHTGPTVREKFAQARSAMKAALVERDEEVDLVLTALLAREHPLLVGPPGTAKSLLLDSLTGWVDGAKKFSVLLSKFSTPEEVFGPVSVQGLKQDQYRRVTTGKLPEADLAFVDEVFKGSTAILNTLLRVLNERTYENGDGTARRCPLLMCVAASNEWPSDQDGGRELGALFDRFLFRKKVRPVTAQAGRKALLKKAVNLDDCRPNFPEVITPGEALTAHSQAAKLDWTPEARKALWEVLAELNREGIFPGDRRVFKSVMAARASAYLHGADEVLPEHLEVLQHVLWDDPTEQPQKCAQVVSQIANPVGFKINDLLMQAEDVCSKGVPAERVPKLKAIAEDLEKMGADPRAVKAARHVRGLVKENYNAVLGVREEE